MIQSYFDSEKKAGFVALAIGLLACTVASAFFISAQPPFYMGLAVSFAAIGIFEVIVGANLARNSDFQGLELKKLQESDPREFVQQEAPRMEKLMNNFKYYKMLGPILVLAGLFLSILNKGENFANGLGCAALLQSPVVKIFTTLAEKRATKYSEYVNTLLPEKQ